MTHTYERHPLSECWPAPQSDETDELRNSLNRHGYLAAFPIVIHEDQILDGWQRYGLCVDLNLEPVTVVYAGDDPAGFVIGVHVGRRNLTAKQRVRAVLNCREWRKPGAAPKGATVPPTDAELAAEAQVSTTTLGREKREMRDEGTRPEPKRRAKAKDAKTADVAPVKRRTLFQAMRSDPLTFGPMRNGWGASIFHVPMEYHGHDPAVAVALTVNPADTDAEWAQIVTAGLDLNEQHQAAYDAEIEIATARVLAETAKRYAKPIAALHKRTAALFATIGKSAKLPPLHTDAPPPLQG